jgi:serine/threonine protein kinase
MSAAQVGEDVLLESLVGHVADEFLRRQEQGERPDVEEYVARHPEAAPVLRKVLAALGVLERSLAGAAAPAAGPVEPAAALGDFRILREVGRGGMGVVYAAEQLSLGRRVALKVLPLAAALDAKQLRRFQIEAQAAASLQHPHIVPVYAVGCERGIHFYAMQLIEGQTVAALIQELRQFSALDGADEEGVRGEGSGARAVGGLFRSLTSGSWPPPERPAGIRPSADTTPMADHSTREPAFFRTVAHLGVQTAEALEHAHQLGVVHRDVKPANLLVDALGHLWVTDFGLAQLHGGGQLTMTGDLLGTLRYASPEQALAGPAPLDHRTDIYSLGATLYELLTQEPACGGRSREEVLRCLTSEEPRPLRRLNRAVPAELETIVLKALAREPAERYTTAQEMADDLRRFLEDRPIRARPPALRQRLARWARRHRPLVASGAVFLVVAVAGLAAATLLIWRAEREATAGWASAQAAVERESQQRQRAEANMELAWEAAERMYATALEEWLASLPGLEEAPRRFLSDALAFYERFADENGANPKVRRETARAHSRVGRIHDRLGAPDKADAAFRRAVDLQQGLADEFPDEPGCRYDLAVSLLNWSDSLIPRNRYDEAEQHCRRAQPLLKKLREGWPRSALYKDGAARLHNALGTVSERTGRAREAGEQFDESVALCRELREEAPASAYYRRGLAVALHNRGSQRQNQGQLREAEDDLRESNDLKRRLVKEFPSLAVYRADQANGSLSLGTLLRQTGRLPAAEQSFREALPLWQRLAEDFPRVHDLRHGLARTRHQLGRLLRAMGRLPEAEREIEQTLPVLQELADEVPRVAVYRHDLALGNRDLGDLRRDAGRLAEAEVPLRRAQDLLQRLADEYPRMDLYRQALASAHNNLGGVLGQLGRLDEALAEQRAALTIRRGLVDDFPDKPEHHDSVASSLHNLAGLLRRRGDLEGGVPLLREAIDHESVARAKRPGHGPYREFMRRLHLVLADTQAGLGRYADAASTVGALPALAPERWEYAFDAASILTLCGRLAAKDAALAEDRRQILTQTSAEQARSWLEEAARRAADDPASLNALAWVVASDADLSTRDARWAVELAGRAVKRRPEVAAFRCTLGVARYRAGEWRTAAEVLEKARATLKGPQRCVAGFALAMACWQAGERERARSCYEEAAWDGRALAAPDPSVERFRAEAAALLGSKEPAP